MDRYQVYSLDVWGGQEEGTWELNAWYDAGIIEIPEEASNKDVINLLIEEGYFKEAARELVEVDDPCNGWLHIVKKEDQYPLYNLELITGE